MWKQARTKTASGKIDRHAVPIAIETGMKEDDSKYVYCISDK